VPFWFDVFECLMHAGTIAYNSMWLILMTVDDSFNRREAHRAASFLSFFLSFCHSSFLSRAISIVPIRTYKMMAFHTISPSLSLSSNIIFNRPFCGKK